MSEKKKMGRDDVAADSRKMWSTQKEEKSPVISRTGRRECCVVGVFFMDTRLINIRQDTFSLRQATTILAIGSLAFSTECELKRNGTISALAAIHSIARVCVRGSQKRLKRKWHAGRRAKKEKLLRCECHLSGGRGGGETDHTTKRSSHA